MRHEAAQLVGVHLGPVAGRNGVARALRRAVLGAAVEPHANGDERLSFEHSVAEDLRRRERARATCLVPRSFEVQSWHGLGQRADRAKTRVRVYP